jgi:hypothetical protein
VTKIEDIGYVEKDMKKQNLKNRAPSVRSAQPRWEPKDLRKAVLVSQGYKTAQMVLQQLFTMKEIEVFQPGYGPAKHFPSLQRNPMDFNEVNRRLGQCKYVTLFRFLNDCKQVFNFFGDNVDDVDFVNAINKVHSYFNKIIQEFKQDQRMHPDYPPLQKKTSFNAKKVTKTEAGARSAQPMTYSERQQLGLAIKHLTTKQLKGIVTIMQEGRENQNEVVLEFDLNTLADEKCRALEAYVKRCQSQTKKAPAKVVPNKAIKT